METADLLTERAGFIAVYAAHLLGCGVHSSRVVRCTRRIGEALGFEVNLGINQKSIVLTLQDRESQRIISKVHEIPELPVSFEHNSELSALSWESVDRHLSYDEIREKFRTIVNAPKMDPLFMLIMVGFANASFCRLFGGDVMSMAIVFSATIAGFFIKTQLQKLKINHYIAFIISAFIASLFASTSLIFGGTAEVALATSVLFLIPGVPLINGVIDIVEGHTMMGISRLTNAILLIACIAIGLSLTLFMVKDRLL